MFVGKRRRNVSDRNSTTDLKTKYVHFFFLLLPELEPDVERQTESFADSAAPGQVTVKRFSG